MREHTPRSEGVKQIGWARGTQGADGVEDERAREEGELARIEQQLHVCWRELAEAEQRGTPEHLLERKYATYLRLLDAYVAQQRRLRGRVPRSRLAS